MDQKAFAAMGGRARAAVLAPERRREISRDGVKKRWDEFYERNPEALAKRQLKDARKGKRGRPPKKRDLNMPDTNLQRLIIEMKESLERQIETGFAEIAVRLARLEHQGAMWKTVRHWSAAVDDWAEKVDASLEAKDRQIGELRQRVSELERKIA